MMLIAGIGLMVWYYARRREESPVIIPSFFRLKMKNKRLRKKPQ